MRVISGTAGGIRLDCPQGIARPMMDRVRAAVFSSLGDFITDARAMDLFAGSGGIGIEALSRGAASCIFIDRNRKAIEAIRGNLKRAKLQGNVRMQDVAAAVHSAPPASLDIVFADPPFALETDDPSHPINMLASGSLAACIAPGGLFVVELPSEPPAPSSPWELIRNRQYGQAWVAFYRRNSDDA